jgi:hypothetical protein
MLMKDVAFVHMGVREHLIHCRMRALWAGLAMLVGSVLIHTGAGSTQRTDGNNQIQSGTNAPDSDLRRWGRMNIVKKPSVGGMIAITLLVVCFLLHIGARFHEQPEESIQDCRHQFWVIRSVIQRTFHVIAFPLGVIAYTEFRCESYFGWFTTMVATCLNCFVWGYGIQFLLHAVRGLLKRLGGANIDGD